MMDFNDPNRNWLPPGFDPYKGMDDNERWMVGCLQAAAFLGMLALGLTLCLLMGSCTTTKVVEVERIKTDTTYITRTARDSIYVQDSVYVREKGDTVWVTRWKTVWQNHTAHDTIYKSRVDSVPVPYPVEKEVAAELTWWQQARLHLANIMLFALAIVAGVWIYRKTRP